MRTPILNHEQLCSQMRELGKKMKLPEIAESLGIHYNTALHLKRRHNITVRTVQDDAADIERFIRSNPELSAKEVAKQFGISLSNAFLHRSKVFRNGFTEMATIVKEGTAFFNVDAVIDWVTGWTPRDERYTKGRRKAA